MIRGSIWWVYAAIAVAGVAFGSATTVAFMKPKIEAAEAKEAQERVLKIQAFSEAAHLQAAIESQNARIDNMAEAAEKLAEMNRIWEKDARYWYQRALRERIDFEVADCDSLPVINWRELLNASR